MDNDEIAETARNASDSPLQKFHLRDFKLDSRPDFVAFRESIDDDLKSMADELEWAMSKDNPESLMGMQRQLVKNQERQLAKQDERIAQAEDHSKSSKHFSVTSIILSGVSLLVAVGALMKSFFF